MLHSVCVSAKYSVYETVFELLSHSMRHLSPLTAGE